MADLDGLLAADHLEGEAHQVGVVELDAGTLLAGMVEGRRA